MNVPPATSLRLMPAPDCVRHADTASGHTWFVASDGSAEFTSISDAVDAAEPGDTISIAAGLYLESLHIEKAIHLIGPGDPRFVEDADGADDGVSAVIVGTGFETIRWTAAGGSIRDLVITRAVGTHQSMLATAMLRVHSGKVAVERCILADGAQSAVAGRHGDITMVRCHIRNVSIGMGIVDTSVELHRTHIEGVDSLALNMGSGSTATLVDNSFEGQTVLRGDIQAFEGNDIDTLVIHGAMSLAGNRVSTVVQTCDFRADASLAANAFV